MNLGMPALPLKDETLSMHEDPVLFPHSRASAISKLTYSKILTYHMVSINLQFDLV